MTSIAVTRRRLLTTGACALVGAVSLRLPASASGSEGQDSANEELVRRWYAAWKNKDLDTFNALLADDFTFSSAASYRFTPSRSVASASDAGSARPPRYFARKPSTAALKAISFSGTTKPCPSSGKT